MRRAVATLDQALICNKCRAKASVVEEHWGSNFSPGEVWLISCPNSSCKEKAWYFCKSCHSRSYQNSLAKHGESKKHQRNSIVAYPNQDQVEPLNVNLTVPAVPAVIPTQPIPTQALELQATGGQVCNKESEPMETSQTAMETTPTTLSHFPKVKMDGNEWLDKLLAGTKKATRDEVIAAFAKPELEHLTNFYVSELASGDGKCGGGLIYLAARAFAQAKDSQLEENQYPDYNEAKWQVNYMIQYQSMNEKQRERQSHIDQPLVSLVKDQGFFKVTYLPPLHQLGRYYGSSGQHSIYNGLPAPRAVDIDGVAYVSPLATIAFVMAMGIPIDDIVVTAQDSPVSNSSRRVHNVDQCRKASNWYSDIQKNYYGSESPAGAPPKYPAVICLPLSDWSDGFDSAKVKSNRSAIQSKTFTVSPPKHAANGTDNTFAVALGLKKASGWKKVEAMFRKELEELTQATEPILLYHGVVQKMVPCFFKRFAVLSDKAERNTLTGTLGCGSNLHKCFGISGNIQTPSCRIHELEEFILQQRNGEASAEYGWSETFIEKESKNGGIFPSCNACRRAGLQRILGLCKDNELDSQCRSCHKWDLVAPAHRKKILRFPPHKDYPQTIEPGSPVPPPTGRDVFGEDVNLPFVEMSWELMIQACKFAFYQASQQKSWTKAGTVCYLKHCGVSAQLAAALYESAKLASKGGGEQPVNYDSSVKIGNFNFDPAWLSKDIMLQDFIEAVMHQLFLGAAESNYELITMWLSDLPKAANINTSGFLRALQDLIKDLRGFGLSWLIAYPLTGQKGKLGTGSWVAENWVFLVRVSQFIFGWCRRDQENATKYGVDDMSRMVLAFHAFVARCLTHSGIDEQGIVEAELYLKEFLSALREFDVRVRSKKLNKTTSKVSELKGTEAWWLKPNYMSLRNLIVILRILGPLVLWWDGGGRGERFIQLVKPHIKRGVRGDALNFFVSLIEKLFRVRIIDIFENRYEMNGNGNGEPMANELEEETTFVDILDAIADILGEDNGAEQEEEKEGDGGDDEMDQDDLDYNNDDDHKTRFTSSEIHGMTKTKAFYIYRNHNQLEDDIQGGKPISGIVAINETPNGTQVFEFQVVFRKPVKQLARRRVVFNDTEGVNFHGMWCATLTVEEENEQDLPPLKDDSAMKNLQAIAKMSAVAIPLWYVLGPEHVDSNKFCVITNWWKNRTNDGSYELPSLDPKLYSAVKPSYDIDKLYNKAVKEATRARHHQRKGSNIRQTGII